ncbi:hypothetical protein ES708_31028 [subsurface metagenome]
MVDAIRDVDVPILTANQVSIAVDTGNIRTVDVMALVAEHAALAGEIDANETKIDAIPTSNIAEFEMAAGEHSSAALETIVEVNGSGWIFYLQVRAHAGAVDIVQITIDGHVFNGVGFPDQVRYLLIGINPATGNPTLIAKELFPFPVFYKNHMKLELKCTGANLDYSFLYGAL